MTTIAIEPKRAIAATILNQGSITPTSSLLVEKIGAVLPPGTITDSRSGGITPSGNVTPAVSGPSTVTVSAGVAGSIAPVGDAAPVALPTTIGISTAQVDGSITPTGSASNVRSGPNIVTIPTTASGSIAPVGSCTPNAGADGGVATKSIGGTITPTGVPANVASGPSLVTVPKSIGGSITPVGVRSASSVIAPPITNQDTAGTITPVGAVARLAGGPSIVTLTQSMSGGISPSGFVGTLKSGPSFVTIPKAVTAVITPTGSVARVVQGPSFVTVPKSVVGSITPHGSRSASVIGGTPGAGRPIGPFTGLGETVGAASFNYFLDAYSASNIIGRIDAAIAGGYGLLLAMTGGSHSQYMTNNVFDMSKWQTKQNTYNTSAIKAKVAQGVASWIAGGGGVIGDSVMDEPQVCNDPDSGGNTWGPCGTMTKVKVDSMASFVKNIFPTLAVGVTHKHTKFEPTKSYTVIDFIIDHYTFSEGSIDTYVSEGLAMGLRDNHVIQFGFNALDGGTRIPGCPQPQTGGPGTFSTNCRMTAAQVQSVGIKMVQNSPCCSFWRYDDTFNNIAGVIAAFAAIRAVADTLPRLSMYRGGQAPPPQPPVYYTDTGIRIPTYPPMTIAAGSSARDPLTTHKIFKLMDNGTVQTAEYTPLNADCSAIYYFNGAGVVRIADLVWTMNGVQLANIRSAFGTGQPGEVDSVIWDRLTKQWFYYAAFGSPAAIYRRDIAANTSTQMKNISADPSFTSFWSAQVGQLRLAGLHASRNQEVLCGVVYNGTTAVGAVAWGRLTSFLWNYAPPVGRVVSRVNVDDQGTFMKVNFTDGTWQVATLGVASHVTLSALLSDSDPPVRDDARQSEFWQASGRGVKKWTTPSTQVAGVVVYSHPQKISKIDTFSKADLSMLAADDTTYYSTYQASALTQPWVLHSGNTYKLNWSAEMAADANKLAPEVLRQNGVALTKVSGLSGGGTATGFHVTPSGTTNGSGTLSSPWSLAFAFSGANGAITPGSTVWIHAGTYAQNFSCTTAGTPASPKVFRVWPGDRVILRALGINAADVWIWGIEPTGGTDSIGIDIRGARAKAINCFVHHCPDSGIGVGFGAVVPDVEVYGCLMGNNGLDQNLDHGLYIQNGTGFLDINDCLLWKNCAYGVHAYSSAGDHKLDNIRLNGVVSWQNGSCASAPDIFIGSEPSKIRGHTQTNCYTYRADSNASVRIGYVFSSQQNETAILTNCLYVGGPALVPFMTQVIKTNVREYNTPTFPTTGSDVVVFPNKYEPGRGHVAIYNWALASSISVNVSSILSPGDSYTVYNAEQFLGTPVLTGIYAGGNISIPVSGRFQAFVVMRPPTAPSGGGTLSNGQWYYDAAAGVLYAAMSDGSNPSTKTISVFDWRFGMEEVIMVNTAGTLKGRLCHHYHHANGSFKGSGISYDASRVVFASNWGGGAQTNIYAVLTDPRL